MIYSMSTIAGRLRNFEFNSLFLRQALALYFRAGRRYRVWWGPLQGMTLEYDAGVNFHVILGVWETANYRFLNRLLADPAILKPGSVVVDMGANLGYFTLWVDRLLRRAGGKVWAFEPSPSILPMLKRNLAANRATQVELVQMACSDHEGTVDFYVGDHHHISSLDGAWASQGKGLSAPIQVPTTTLDSFFCSSNDAGGPDFIKIDIEGGGVFALRGMDRCIETKRPLIWIESHTPAEDRAIADLILKHDYQAFRLQTGRAVLERGQTHPHPEGVWGTLLLFPSEKTESLRKVLSTVGR